MTKLEERIEALEERVDNLESTVKTLAGRAVPYAGPAVHFPAQEGEYDVHWSKPIKPSEEDEDAD